MDPEIQKHYKDVNALIAKVHPHFMGVHSFVMMMTLADLIAQWVLSHSPERQPHVVATLIQTTQDRIVQLIDADAEETRH
jgi:hypothetical protein